MLLFVFRRKEAVFPWKGGYFCSFLSVSLCFSLACLTSPFTLSLSLFCLSFLTCLSALFHAKNNIKLLHLKDCFHQYFFFSGFPVLFCLSNPLFLSLLSPLAKDHLTLPFFGVFVFWLLFFLFCAGFVFVAFVFCLHRMSKKGELAHYPPCGPGSKKLFWKWLFWNIKCGVGEGGCLEANLRTTIFVVSLVSFIHVLGHV